MDALHHGPGWTVQPTFETDVDAFVASDSWITVAVRLWPAAAVGARNLMVWVDLPFPITLTASWRTLRRRFHREELWNGNVEGPLHTFLARAISALSAPPEPLRRADADSRRIYPDLPIVRGARSRLGSARSAPADPLMVVKRAARPRREAATGSRPVTSPSLAAAASCGGQAVARQRDQRWEVEVLLDQVREQLHPALTDHEAHSGRGPCAPGEPRDTSATRSGTRRSPAPASCDTVSARAPPRNSSTPSAAGRGGYS